jgi:hypothetical protein
MYYYSKIDTTENYIQQMTHGIQIRAEHFDLQIRYY